MQSFQWLSQFYVSEFSLRRKWYFQQKMRVEIKLLFLTGKSSRVKPINNTSLAMDLYNGICFSSKGSDPFNNHWKKTGNFKMCLPTCHDSKIIISFHISPIICHVYMGLLFCLLHVILTRQGNSSQQIFIWFLPFPDFTIS